MDNIDKFIETCESLMINEDEICVATEAIGEIASLVFVIGVAAASTGLIYSQLKSDLREISKDLKGQSNKRSAIKKKIKDNAKKELENQYGNIKQIDPKEMNKMIDSAYTDIKKIVADLNKSTEFKKEVRDEIDKYMVNSKNRGYPVTKSEMQFKLIAEEFERGNKPPYMIIEVISGTQEVRLALSFVIWNIAEIIEAKYPALSIGTGDGDEGCIYINQ